MTRWEYYWADVSEGLSKLGAEGWEAVGVSNDMHTYGPNDNIRTETQVLMKRPIAVEDGK